MKSGLVTSAVLHTAILTWGLWSISGPKPLDASYAEALLATAIGLVAAIPAVIAYNKLSADAGKLGMRLEAFADEFSAILSRQIDEKTPAR